MEITHALNSTVVPFGVGIFCLFEGSLTLLAQSGEIGRVILTSHAKSGSHYHTYHSDSLISSGIWLFASSMAFLKGFVAWHPPQYQTLVFVMGFALPAIVIIYCYCNIYKEVRGKKHSSYRDKQQQILLWPRHLTWVWHCSILSSGGGHSARKSREAKYFRWEISSRPESIKNGLV